MYDAGKILIGLIVFLGFATFPFWNDGGKAVSAPKPEITAYAKKIGHCVEPEKWMRANHMQLLDHWRDSAVREDKRVYVSSTGEKYDISLQNTCLKCHSNQEKFCDRCHQFAGVRELYCWDCHLESKEIKKWAATDESF